MGENTVKILIVDDDPFVRDMLTFILEAGEYEVSTAENGFEAFEKCTSDPTIGLLISDMNMPVMSGLELTRELRKQNVDIPILVLTGDGEIAAAGEAVRSGANGFLVKDENIWDTILDALAKMLAAHPSRQ